MNKTNCALIMAGGKGTRFWPKSTEEMPKQFLKLIGNKTMIQETFERINKTIPESQIFVITCEKYKKIVEQQLETIPKENIIIEPVGRNTAPCILLASLYIKQIYKNANIAVFPSDHIISDTESFLNILNTANKYLENNSKSIVTIGIKPSRPETGFGYIKFSNKKDLLNEIDIINVEKFVEKPDLETAGEYLKSGNYLWNAGMFIFDCNYMLEELKDKLNNEYKLLNDLPTINSKNYYEELKKVYSDCENISIDYAIMEKSNSIKVIPADIGWDDIGTWNSLKRYIEPDISNNYIKGNVETINSSNNIIYAENKKIIFLDIDNVFCIDSNDVLIIGKANSLSEVHKLGKIKNKKEI